MGQYYEAVLRIKENQFVKFSPHSFNQGAKLLEHAHLNNSFVENVIYFLLNNPKQLAWIGDYAELDDVSTSHAIQFLNELELAVEKRTEDTYKEIFTVTKSKEHSLEIREKKYLIFNKTKKEYVDIEEYKKVLGSDDRWNVLHPLPILTSIGNGKGGGDYYEASPCYIRVGSWACDTIVVIPKSNIPEEYKGYKNIIHEVLFLDD